MNKLGVVCSNVVHNIPGDMFDTILNLTCRNQSQDTLLSVFTVAEEFWLHNPAHLTKLSVLNVSTHFDCDDISINQPLMYSTCSYCTQ